MTEQTRTDEVTIPSQAAPERAEPTAAEPTPEEPQVAEPAAVEPQVAEPAAVEPTHEEPQVAEPAAVEGTSAEPAPADGVAPLPVPASPPRRRLRDRRGLRAAARWTAALLVFGVLGGAAAYGVTQPERTEIPGLRTPDDGRWTYPALKLPKLPEGAPRPMDAQHNAAGRHYADPRTLLLPAPAGAKVDRTFPDRTGWLPTADFVKVFQTSYRAELTRTLAQDTLRHIAARAWTAQDGTRTEVYLLQFATQAYARETNAGLAMSGTPAQAASTAHDEDWGFSDVLAGQSADVFDESEPRGPQHVRVAYVQAGDTVAVILLSKAGTQPAVPFHQTVKLQAQLLG
ncbi:hypothetical protein [Streptomyces sp. NPDC088733]|uniref:hypothetical protein n=1 Tax=Streptomyces sp. NPDC088733 TaxID=3365880 RepID=UPI00381F8E14